MNNRLLTILLLLLTCFLNIVAQDANPNATNGRLPGRFTISEDGQQVYFSQGNLRHCNSQQAAKKGFWFATHQYDYLGGSNVGGGLATTIDLFGWSGTTYRNWGRASTTSSSNYAGEFLDWGTNPIRNGGDSAGIWSTLNDYEWMYLLTGRPRADSLWGFADVMGKKGIVLLPDTSTLTIQHDYDSWDWSIAEQAGAVFLPLGGERKGATKVMDAGNKGFYWSRNAMGSDEAKALQIFNNNQSILGISAMRWRGFSVRLVERIPMVLLEAQPQDECQVFLQWSDGITINPRLVDADIAGTITPIFDTRQVKIVVNTDDDGDVSVTL